MKQSVYVADLYTTLSDQDEKHVHLKWGEYILVYFVFLSYF
jgi:hypothetical protein